MKKNAEMDFEKSLQRLEQIVDELSGPNQTLENALVLFEEGIGLARFCSERLNNAQMKVEKLIKSIEGSLEIEPMDI